MTRYPRQVDREYLSCRAGGLNQIQMIDGGTLDLHQDLVACDRRRRYIAEHQLPTVFHQSDSFHASSLFARADCKRGKSRDALPPRTAPRSTSFNAECCNPSTATRASARVPAATRANSFPL